MEDAKEFIYEGLKTFEQADLASRLTLSSLPAVVASNNIHDLPVTIIDVFDDCSLTQVSIFLKLFPITPKKFGVYDRNLTSRILG